MKPRTIFILWSVAIALAVAIFILKNSQNNRKQETTNRVPGEKLLPGFPAEKIASIEIQDGEKSVSLLKEKGNWVVEERDRYPADTREINQLLRTLTQLKVTQNIEAGPSFAPHFGMNEESSDPSQHGVVAIFKDTSGTKLSGITVGKNLEAPSANSPLGGGILGRYIRNHEDDSGFYAVGEAFATLSPSPKDWLSTEFLEIEKIKTISVTKPGSEETAWELTRNDEPGELLFSDEFPDLKTNLNATNPLKVLFAYSHFDDILTEKESAELKPSEKVVEATITTFEGFAYHLTMQPKANEERTYLMTVEVSADLPEERKKAAGETEEQAAEADSIFEERLEVLSARLAKDKSFEGKTFVVPQTTVAPLLKTREDLTESPQPSASAEGPVPPRPPNP